MPLPVIACDTTNKQQTLVNATRTTATVYCRSGCIKNGTVWGTGPYEFTSRICPAAIHAGAITDAGGLVELAYAPGQAFYNGAQWQRQPGPAWLGTPGASTQTRSACRQHCQQCDHTCH